MDSSTPAKKRSERGPRSSGRVFYTSKRLAAKASDSGEIVVNLSLGDFDADIESLAVPLRAFLPSPEAVDLLRLGRLLDLTKRRRRMKPEVTSGTNEVLAEDVKVVRAALRQAAEGVIARVVDQELKGFAESYRSLLREGLVKGESPQVEAALNRVRLQEKILAKTEMVDQVQACELLSLSNTNASATMKRKEERGEILRFLVDGRPGYPLFQFDLEGRRLYPVIARLIGARPEAWSDFRLLHWLTRPHLDFDGAPAKALSNEEAIMAAFTREIEPVVHG